MINLLWYFVLFSFLGWLITGVRTMFYEKKFSNKGFLTSPFCPLYGLGAVICYLSVCKFAANELLVFAVSTVVLSVFMAFSGAFIHRLLGFKPWDFSREKLHIGSYITLPYAILFGIIGLMLVTLVIPVLDTALEFIPYPVNIIIISVCCAVMAVDYVFSTVTTLRLQKKIKELSGISALLGSDVDDNQIAELENNYNKLFTEGVLRRRLASAFPELKNTEYVREIAVKIEEVKSENMKEYTQTFENEEDKPFAFGLCFTKLFFLFVIGSFIGTIVETIWALLMDGHFEVRVGMVYGPFIPVYGGGACFLTVVLYKLYKLSDTLIFVISAVVGAAFEYFCSWFQEAAFGTISWDYSNTPFNLNGRTNLMYALIWGFLGLVWVRYIYPWCARLIEKIPKRAGAVISTVLIVFMLFNAFISAAATIRWTQRTNGVEPSSKFELYLDRRFNNEKMEFLFPNMKKTTAQNPSVNANNLDKTAIK